MAGLWTKKTLHPRPSSAWLIVATPGTGTPAQLSTVRLADGAATPDALEAPKNRSFKISLSFDGALLGDIVAPVEMLSVCASQPSIFLLSVPSSTIATWSLSPTASSS